MDNQINIAINSIKVLRSNVGEIFNTLANGCTEDQETNTLIELQDLLNKINQNVR